MSSMAVQIAVIAAMMLTTSATHIGGLWLLDWVAGHFTNGGRRRHRLVLLGVVLGLLGVHTVEILEYAVLYRFVSPFDLETAVYFSASSYSTIGAALVHLPHEWRLVGAFEGINGFIMIGWSTTFLFTMWKDIPRAGDEEAQD